MSKVMTRTVTVGLEDGTIEEFQIDANEPEDRLPRVLEGALRARQRAKTPWLPTRDSVTIGHDHVADTDSFDINAFLDQYRG